MTLTFDELLDLAARDGKPLEIEIRSLGKKVFIRNPSSADVDEWRLWANRNQGTGKPMAAKVVQIMMCDQFGERIVPQTDEALAVLADGNPKVIDEIASSACPCSKSRARTTWRPKKKTEGEPVGTVRPPARPRTGNSRCRKAEA